MHHSKLISTSLFLIISLFSFSNAIAQLRLEELLIMPPQIKMIKKISTERTKDFNKRNDPTNLDTKGLEQYEEKYLKKLSYFIRNEFMEKKRQPKILDPKNLDEDDKTKTDDLYRLVWGEYNAFRSTLPGLKKRNQLHLIPMGRDIQPLTEYFSDKENRDYILIIQIRGYHNRKIYEERKNKPYPDILSGSLSVYGLIVNAETGLIMKEIREIVGGRQGETYLNDAKLKRLAKNFVKRFK